MLTCQVARNQAAVSGGSGGYVILGWIVRRMPVRSTVRETCRAHIQNQRNVLSEEGGEAQMQTVRSPGPGLRVVPRAEAGEGMKSKLEEWCEVREEGACGQVVLIRNHKNCSWSPRGEGSTF